MRKWKNLKELCRDVKINLLTNVVMSILVISVGLLCFAPTVNAIETASKGENVYRNAGSDGKGVSLLFNVYWGTEEVYRILDILKEFDGKATFFIGGCWADDNVACLRAIVDAGHEIGNHGYFHKEHNKMNLAQNLKEISDCNQFIKLATGVEVRLFAPPSGAYNEQTLSACKQLSMTTILWSKDTIDWRDKDAKLIYQRATKNVTIGDFILMHPMKETADALKDILKTYQENGLKTVTVSENLLKEG